MRFNINEAKAQFSALVEMAMGGKEVVIAKAGKPVARIVPISGEASSKSGVKLGGLKRIKLKLSKDFYEPTSDADLIG